jgi:hypothetical protein
LLRLGCQSNGLFHKFSVDRSYLLGRCLHSLVSIQGNISS